MGGVASGGQQRVGLSPSNVAYRWVRDVLADGERHGGYYPVADVSEDRCGEWPPYYRTGSRAVRSTPERTPVLPIPYAGPRNF